MISVAIQVATKVLFNFFGATAQFTRSFGEACQWKLMRDTKQEYIYMSYLSSFVWRSTGSCVSLSIWKRTSGDARVKALKPQKTTNKWREQKYWQENLKTKLSKQKFHYLKKRTKIKLFLPLLDPLLLKNLCQIVEMSQTPGYFISLAWIVNSHLSFGIREGHLKKKCRAWEIHWYYNSCRGYSQSEGWKALVYSAVSHGLAT